MATDVIPPHQQPHEPHREGTAQRLNWLRAGVLGANDGIVSVAAIVVGVAGATVASSAIITAGAAALIGGAISMALGEYVSVSGQRDSERSLIAKEKRELEETPEEELLELAGLYEARGLTEATALQVAKELTAKDALAAHLSAELNIDQNDVVSPWNAAFASAVAFLSGGVIPLIVMLFTPASIRVPATFVVVIVALAGTGILSARLGGSKPLIAAVRVVIGGTIALVATFTLGALLGTTGVV
jgi:VIT1/CCC1 family predicted Fe2+/Mn2+ transporter